MYLCEECELGIVMQQDGTPVRACDHTNAGILAVMSSTLSGGGGMEQTVEAA